MVYRDVVFYPGLLRQDEDQYDGSLSLGRGCIASIIARLF
jgi:hypothetical protein